VELWQGGLEGMVKTYIGGKKKEQELDFPKLIDYDTITITPNRINGMFSRSHIDPEIPIEIIVECIVNTCEQLINSYLEHLNDEILLKPIKFAVERDIMSNGFDIGIKPNRSVSHEYKEFVPQLKELLNRH
jgi:hypothetical protein